MVGALRALAARWPRFGFSLARVLAWLSRPLGRGIREERLAEALPRLSDAELRAARHETWRNFLQDQALDAHAARAAPREVAWQPCRDRGGRSDRTVTRRGSDGGVPHALAGRAPARGPGGDQRSHARDPAVAAALRSRPQSRAQHRRSP